MKRRRSFEGVFKFERDFCEDKQSTQSLKKWKKSRLIYFRFLIKNPPKYLNFINLKNYLKFSKRK